MQASYLDINAETKLNPDTKRIVMSVQFSLAWTDRQLISPVALSRQTAPKPSGPGRQCGATVPIEAARLLETILATDLTDFDDVK